VVKNFDKKQKSVKRGKEKMNLGKQPGSRTFGSQGGKGKPILTEKKRT